MAAPGVAVERLRAHEIATGIGHAPVAWIRFGALEFHTDHLPDGTDGFTAHGLVAGAAARPGGVVLPRSYSRSERSRCGGRPGTTPTLVAGVIRQTLLQLAANDVRVAVSEGPNLRRVLPRAQCRAPDRAQDELAGQGRPRLDDGDLAEPRPRNRTSSRSTRCPTIRPRRSSASTRRTDARSGPPVAARRRSWRQPRCSRSGSAGQLRREALDTHADLRGFVERYWAEPLVVSGRAAQPAHSERVALLLTNPGPVSRYLTALALELDRAVLGVADLVPVNRTAGETGVATPVAELGRQRGFCVRRNQTAELLLAPSVTPGLHEAVLTLELAGVREHSLRATVELR